MSGSGGGGGSYGGGGAGGDGNGSDSGPKEPDCDIVRRDALTSPDPKVLAQLKRGTICKVVLRQEHGKARVVVEYNGDIAGILFFQGFTRLIECIRRGHTYIAIVQAVRGGWCEVEIRPAPVTP